MSSCRPRNPASAVGGAQAHATPAAERAAVSGSAPTVATLANITQPSGRRCVCVKSGATTLEGRRDRVPGSTDQGRWVSPVRARHCHALGPCHCMTILMAEQAPGCGWPFGRSHAARLSPVADPCARGGLARHGAPPSSMVDARIAPPAASCVPGGDAEPRRRAGRSCLHCRRGGRAGRLRSAAGSRKGRQQVSRRPPGQRPGGRCRQRRGQAAIASSRDLSSVTGVRDCRPVASAVAPIAGVGRPAALSVELDDSLAAGAAVLAWCAASPTLRVRLDAP